MLFIINYYYNLPSILLFIYVQIPYNRIGIFISTMMRYDRFHNSSYYSIVGIVIVGK